MFDALKRGLGLGTRLGFFRERERQIGVGRSAVQLGNDVALANQSYAVFVRSPHAHAVLKKIHTEKAKQAPGVLAVYTGEDLAAAKVGGLPCGWLITDVNGKPMKEPPYPPLAQGKVRHVGERVAVVIAETLAQARDAAELVKVDYQELPAVVDGRKAASSTALHDIAPDNTCYVWALGDKAKVDEAFAKAAHVTKLDFVNNRLVPNAIEPRAANATYSRAGDEYTLYVASQNPHVERLLMTAFVLGLPESKVRVVAPDVGGGFGAKLIVYPEDVLVPFLARRLARPVRWLEDRLEHMLAATQEREQRHEVTIGFDDAGRLLALRDHFVHDTGAYTPRGLVVPLLSASMLTGPYRIDAVESSFESRYTHRVPVTPRGSGTGLSGACVAERGGILLGFDRMAEILEIDTENHIAVVQPGVTLEQLNARVVELAERAFRSGGRLLYVGAGTSGRLGVLDAAECPPTYGTPPELVVGIIAGGPPALVRSVEGAEDDRTAGAAVMDEHRVGGADLVVGIAASGTTP